MNRLLNAVYKRENNTVEELLQSYQYKDRYELDETLKWVLSAIQELEYHEKIHYAERLLFAGASPCGKNYDGTPFLNQLVYSHDIVLFNLLIGFGPDVNERGVDGDTSLHAVVDCAVNRKECSLEMLRHLLSLGANPHLKDDNGFTPLAYFLSNLEVEDYDKEFAELLIMHSNVNIVNYNKQSSLHLSLKNSFVCLEMISFIVAASKNINAKDSHGTTALMWCLKAIRSESSIVIQIVELLLGNGADINLTDSLGNTALHYVCQCQKDLKILDCILTKGAFVNARNGLNETPFFLSLGNYDYMKRLISINADINVEICSLPKVKLTALGLAEVNCDLASIILIIFCGGIYNATTVKCTLLHIQFSHWSTSDVSQFDTKLQQEMISQAKKMISSVRPLSCIARTVIQNSLRCSELNTKADTQQAYYSKLSILESIGILPLRIKNFLLFDELFNDEQWYFRCS